ncbi:cell division protein FtsQ/DivIB, partial [uncultured Cellulomonas sp.]|uniref:cell division protein FtsQ/DivIB n=1 Tax=uncultured Cellulomonas sp. TaxID=189682 RepID=UPI0028ED074A
PARASTPAAAAKPATTPTASVPADQDASFGRAVTTYSAAGARRLAGPVTPPVVSTISAERFAERARARRNLARRQVLVVASSAVAVVALGWLLFFSPVLALDPAQVTVEGAGTVVAVDQVRGVVDAQATTPLPRLDTVRLRDQVLDVPGVREARVTREWPRGLLVVLVAREPVAAVPEQPGNEDPATRGVPGFALLDMDGVQVGRVDAAPDGLPVVDVPVGDKRTLSAVLSVLQQLPADLLAQVGGVSARTQDTVTMNLRDNVRVDWGSAQETPLKVAVLSALRASPAAAGATVIDVSAPRLPITK